MNRRAICAAILVFVSLSLAAFGEDGEIEASNLSANRTVGIGIQAEFPWGGLISARYWATDALGVEGVFFVLANDGETSGIATARALWRVVDAEAVDFYVAAGGSFSLGVYPSPAIGILVGGIEVDFSRRFAWNVEFGLSATIYGEVWTTFGTGIHFYF